MLARVEILLPFTFHVPEGEKFNVYESVTSGYRTRILPPKCSGLKNDHFDADQILINGAKAHKSDVFCIDFHKDSFDREIKEESESLFCDPPFDIINEVLKDFLFKTKFVIKAENIQLIDLHDTSWNLTYLKDDETTFEHVEGLVRGRFGRLFQMSYMALTSEIWEDIYSIEDSSNIPPWEELLLDSGAVLPAVGPSVVLSATALEVFISNILNKLSGNGKIPELLWNWINDRGNFIKEPSKAEEYDILLKVLLGISLKENGRLWEAFSNIKNARNSFVHEGVAKVGTTIVDNKMAREYISKCRDIIEYIRKELPDEMKWPKYNHNVKVEMIKEIKKEKDNGA